MAVCFVPAAKAAANICCDAMTGTGGEGLLGVGTTSVGVCGCWGCSEVEVGCGGNDGGGDFIMWAVCGIGKCLAGGAAFTTGTGALVDCCC